MKHRKTNEKLTKKKKFKKNKKQFKIKRQELRQIKKDKDELRKLGYLSKDFSDMVPADEVFSIGVLIGKLITHSDETDPSNHDSFINQDLPGLFKQLDSHTTVDLRGLKDTYVQRKLLKLFKLLKLQHSKTN